MIRKGRRRQILLCGLIFFMPWKLMAQQSGSDVHPVAWRESVLIRPVLSGSPFKVTLSDSWFGQDKVHHFLTSALLSGVGYYVLRDEQRFGIRTAQSGSLIFSLSFGLAKEVRDGFKPQNAFSVKDLVADVCGALLGMVIVADF